MKRAVLFLFLCACGGPAHPKTPMPDRSTTACGGDPVAKESGPFVRDPTAEFEGQPIAKVEVVGNRKILANTIVTASGLRPGQKLTHESAARALHQLYEGGEFEDLEIAVERAEGGVIVFLVVREALRVGEIFAPGIPDARKEEMAKWIGIERGKPFDVAEVTKQRRVIAENMAKRGAKLDVRTHIGSSGEVDVCILLQQ